MAKQQKEDVHEIIRQAVEAGWAAAKSSPKDAYKATERRLYALPVLRKRIEENRESLEELRTYGVRGKSGSITRFCKSGGLRLDPEEAKDRLIQDMDDILHMGGEGGKALLNALLISDVRIDILEDPQDGALLCGDVKARLAHKGQKARRL